MRKTVLLCLLVSPLAVQAATLTSVPMQGGMVMPMISYHASMGHLMVMMPTNVPQLTPLLVSNPSDSFDPLDPWFTDLDPSAKGLSFSRRYGFVMDAMTDPLPPDTAIWIRKLSGDANLDFYRYSGSAPKAWEPIFGSAGSPVARYWDGMMFHPGVAAPPSTNSYTATFEAYLVDTITSNEVAGSGTGPMVFNFTNVPDDRPDLGAGMMFTVMWSTNATNYVVECSTNLASGVWTAVTNTPIVLDGQKAVLLGTEGVGKAYRMRRSP